LHSVTAGNLHVLELGGVELHQDQCAGDLPKIRRIHSAASLRRGTKDGNDGIISAVAARCQRDCRERYCRGGMGKTNST